MRARNVPVADFFKFFLTVQHLAEQILNMRRLHAINSGQLPLDEFAVGVVINCFNAQLGGSRQSVDDAAVFRDVVGGLADFFGVFVMNLTLGIAKDVGKSRGAGIAARASVGINNGMG